MNQSRYFGYFDDISNTPAYDPKHTVPCIICGKPWSSDNVVTISLYKPMDTKSYFYRAHKTCYESLTDEEITNYDSSLIDNLQDKEELLSMQRYSSLYGPLSSAGFS